MAQNIAHNLEEKSRTDDILIKESFNFNSLLLSNTTLQGLKEAGFYKPSPIQLKAIPLGRCGLDLIVQAKSGTGKAAVFTIIALEMINTSKNAVQVLIFAPTREIAIQNEDVIKTIGQAMPGLKVESFIGGLPIEEDYKKLENCHIAVGAPGRLKHLVETSRLKTDSIRLLVLDEADKLMEQCFQSDINFVCRNLPDRKQVIALSATYLDKLDKFLANYMQSPTFVTPEVENPILLGLKQFVTVVKSHLNVTGQILIKNRELIRLLSKISFTQCLVFFNSQTRAEGISHTLNKDGWNTTYISAAQSQTKRIKAVNSLKKFECKILLSTDLTARGIDAANVNLVINYDVPYETATYLHRMGRAGRYGSHGLCVTIVSNGNELKKFRNIIGEIGGSELGIAELPPGEDNLQDIWESDLNSCKKMYGTIDGDNKSVDLQDSVFDLKNCKIKSRPDDIMTSDLEKLSVDEIICQENCQGDEEIEIQSTINTLLNHKEKSKEEIRKNCSEIDTETLLKTLASGENILSNEEQKDSSDMETELILKMLSAGQTIPASKMDEKNQEIQLNSVEKSASLVKDPSVIEIDNQSLNETNPDIINPASLYPWVPVEGSPVLMNTLKGKNLLDDLEEEDFESDQILHNNRKRKRKQYKKSNQKDLDKSPVLIKNLALYSITQLLTNNIEDFNLAVKQIDDYLKNIKENQQLNLNVMLNHFENSTCNDLLENIVQYSKEWSEHEVLLNKPCQEEDPVENIFKLGYFYMNKDSSHWIDALGDKYEPEESEVEEDMEFSEEEEEEQEEVDFEDATNWQPNTETQAHTEDGHYNYNWMPSNTQLNHPEGSTSHEDSYNPTYASYFDYYKNMFENDSSSFEDMASFNNYFSQWQSQVQSVRDYVQQNIYLQEMNNYQNQRVQNYDYSQNNHST